MRFAEVGKTSRISLGVEERSHLALALTLRGLWDLKMEVPGRPLAK